MIEIARNRGIEVVLLFNELWSTPYLELVEKTAHAFSAPWVNSKKLLDDVRADVSREVETRLGLHPSDTESSSLSPAVPAGFTGPVEVVFRIQAGRWPVPNAVYIAGSHPSLGDGVPNRVRLYDDGSHGDERAGDGVWSYAVTFENGGRIFYVYTNSGREGHWEGLDVPDLRFMTVRVDRANARVFRPIETFGALSTRLMAGTRTPKASG